jgi:uncharacterized membrane protein YjgN (DUF898 family)
MNDAISNPFVNPFELPPAPPAAVSRPARVEFTGRRGDFWGLVSRGALLELVTFGFYRFWLATSMRRHLWSNTSVNGDAAEYTGTAKELFIGFLFAVAILAPLYLITFLIGIEMESLKEFASTLLGVFFYLFAQFAIYRARRYRMTRTVWRGVRFSMTGSGISYAWRAALWGLLVVLTLGLALPWQKASLKRYQLRHTAYGDLQGSFAATGGQLFKRGWWLWLLAWPSAFLVIPLPFIYAAFKAIEWRWWVSGVRLGEVRLESDMPKGALIGLYWKLIGWSVVLSTALAGLVGLLIGVATVGVDMARPEEFYLALVERPWILAVGAIGYLVIALASGAVTRMYLIRDVWAKVALSVTVYNLAAADNVVARGDAVSALGEGFANSLDVAGV